MEQTENLGWGGGGGGVGGWGGGVGGWGGGVGGGIRTPMHCTYPLALFTPAFYLNA